MLNIRTTNRDVPKVVRHRELSGESKELLAVFRDTLTNNTAAEWTLEGGTTVAAARAKLYSLAKRAGVKLETGTEFRAGEAVLVFKAVSDDPTEPDPDPVATQPLPPVDAPTGDAVTYDDPPRKALTRRRRS